MTTTETRTERGLRLYRERGAKIIEVESGVFRVPASEGGGFYRVDLNAETCECRDRAPVCKHLVAATVAEAKKRCRRRTTTGRPERRHETAAPRPREQQDGTGRGSGPARPGGINSGRSWGYGVDRETVLAGLGRMEG